MKLNNPFPRMWKGWENFQDLPARTHKSMRNFLAVLLIVDLFLVMYFLDLWTLGVFLFLMIIIFFTMSLIAERRKEDKKMKDYKDEAVEEPQEETVDEDDRGFDVGDMFSDMRKDMESSVESMRRDMSMALRSNAVF